MRLSLTVHDSDFEAVARICKNRAFWISECPAGEGFLISRSKDLSFLWFNLIIILDKRSLEKKHENILITKI